MSGPKGPPMISVVIATRGRPAQLGRCLDALSQLEAPRGGFEVIVVDDAGVPAAGNVVQAFRHGIDVTLLSRGRSGGPAAARNDGAAVARGMYLAFTDDDCRPKTDWLVRLSAGFAGYPGDLIGGRRVNALSSNLFATASQMAMEAAHSYFGVGPDGFFSSSNLAAQTGRFWSVGGFDSSLPASEDRELCDRWRQHGYGLSSVPEAVVFHSHELTFRTYCSQRFLFGRGAYLYHRARAEHIPLRPDTRFYRYLFRYPFAHTHWPRAAILSLLLLIGQAANAAGFLSQRCRSGRKGSLAARP
jgi:GT2 family glycosyltransferase